MIEIDEATLALRQAYFEKLQAASGFKTFAELAHHLGVGVSTLRNIHNGHRFAGPKLIRKIEKMLPRAGSAAILGVNANDASGQTLGERLESVYGQRERLLRAVEEDNRKNIGEVTETFAAMSKDDIFIYVSATRRPLEMDPDEGALQDAIAQALLDGAHFYYIRPDEKYLHALSDFTDIEQEFRAFRERITTRTKAKPIVSLAQIRVPRCGLFTIPDFKWEIFLSAQFQGPHSAMAGALISTRNGASVRVPLSHLATKAILRELTPILRGQLSREAVALFNRHAPASRSP